MLKKPDRDSLNPEALQTLGVGQAYIRTPAQQNIGGICVQIPPTPPGNLPKLPTTIDDLKKRSKANFGVMVKPSASAAVDLDTHQEHVAEPPNTPPAPKPPAQTETPKKPTPKPTTQRKRNRFDDGEEPLIDVH
jgi:hypothetical protein